MDTEPATALRLLLVEDDGVERLLLQRSLRQCRQALYLDEASSVKQACQCLLHHTYDVVLATHHLPDGDAGDILQCILTLPDHRPALVILGQAMELGLEEECITQGAQAFLIREELKPCSLFSHLLQARRHGIQLQLLRAQVAQLQERAEHDALTGLYNRHVFEEQLTACLARGERLCKPFALLMIDLDGFKQVNDHCGHCAGDDVLQRMAGRIAGQCRNGECACRIGGDEFAVLLPDISGEREPAMLAERLSRILDEPIATRHGDLLLHASIGIALYPRHGSSAIDMLHNADLAMYRSKQRKLAPLPAGKPPDSKPLTH